MSKTSSIPVVKESSIGRDSFIMSVLTLLSKFLGFARNFVYGLLFGGVISLGADAFSAANSLPNAIWLMLGAGTLNAILVPAIVRASEHEDGGVDYISRIVTFVSLISIVITAFCMLISPVLIRVINGAMPDHTFTLAMMFSVWLIPQVLLSALVMVFSQILNAFNFFGSTMWAPAINNIVCIVGTVLFLIFIGSARSWEFDDWNFLHVSLIGGASLLGSVGQTAYLYRVLWKNGIKIRPRFGFRGLGLKKLGKLGLWTLLATILGQISVWSVRWAAGSGVEASEDARKAGTDDQIFAGFASVDYSYTVFIMAQSIFVVSLVTAIFPKISRSVIGGKIKEIIPDVKKVSGLINISMGFCTAILIAFSSIIMWSTIGGTGRTAASSAGLVLSGYSISLIPISLNYLVRRVFYAKEDARSVFFMQIPATLIAVVGSALSYVFAPPQFSAAFGVLSMTLGSIVGMLIGFIMLRTLLEDFRISLFFEDFWKILTASGIALCLGFGLYHVTENLMWSGRIYGIGLFCIYSFALFGVYCLSLHLLRSRIYLDAETEVRTRFSKLLKRA